MNLTSGLKPIKHLPHRFNGLIPSPCHFDQMGEISRSNRFLNRRLTPYFKMTTFTSFRTPVPSMRGSSGSVRNLKIKNRFLSRFASSKCQLILVGKVISKTYFSNPKHNLNYEKTHHYLVPNLLCFWFQLRTKPKHNSGTRNRNESKPTWVSVF